MVVVDGRMSGVVVDRRMSGAEGDGDGRRLDTLEAHPHPRVHCPSHTSLRVMVHPACRV